MDAATEKFQEVFRHVDVESGAREVAKLIRSQERSRYTPIIFHTAPESNRLPGQEQAYALGAVDYLVKPIVPFILRAKVAWFIELFQKSEELRQQERSVFEKDLAHERTLLREQQEWLRVTLGSIAVETILTKKPSVVLLDIGLPGMNGYEVAQRVRKQEVE